MAKTKVYIGSSKDTLLVLVHGPLSGENKDWENLASLIEEKIDAGATRVLFDLGACDEVDTPALRVFQTAARCVRHKGYVAVATTDEHALWLFKVVFGHDPVIRVFPSLEAAFEQTSQAESRDSLLARLTRFSTSRRRPASDS